VGTNQHERHLARHEVRVFNPPSVRTPERLEAVLGAVPLPVPRVSSTSILVDGRFHTASCRWLAIRQAKSPATTRRNAADVAGDLSYLLNDRALAHPDPSRSDIFAVELNDVLAYRSHLLHERQLSHARWNQINSSIKQLHEFAHARYGLPTPWTSKIVAAGNSGRMVRSNQLAARTKRGSSGIPLDPYWAEILVQGAMRIGADGTDHSGPAAERDVAYIALKLGLGARRGPAHLLTTHEIPPATQRPFGVARLPDQITKNLAGGDAMAFEHRMRIVRDYIAGPRRATALLGAQDPPSDAITLTHATATDWTGTRRNGTALTRRWTDTGEVLRRQLRDPDGTSPILFLDVQTGTPLSARTMSRIVATARDFARSHIEPDFPAGLRDHDLRHTYAVHLTVAICRATVAELISGPERDAYLTRHVNDAVNAVQASLGHASPETTRLYTTHAAAQLLSGIPTDAYFGRFV
jgi:integrase